MTEGNGPTRMRASDAEREEFAEFLRAAVADGRLSLAEGDERLAKAYAATYRDELAPLTTDLPVDGPTGQQSEPDFAAHVRRRLRRHGTFTVLVAGGLVAIWALTGAHFFWPLLPLLFLAFGFARHWRFAHSPWARGGWRGGPFGGWPGTGGPACAGSADRGRGWDRSRGSERGWDGGDWRGGPPRGRGRW